MTSIKGYFTANFFFIYTYGMGCAEAFTHVEVTARKVGLTLSCINDPHAHGGGDHAIQKRACDPEGYHPGQRIVGGSAMAFCIFRCSDE